LRAFWITTLALASMVCANAQDVPPLPPLRGDAASLPDTMRFIQNKLPSKVNYMVYSHNNVAGTDLSPDKRIFEVTDVSADTSRCYISFHSRFDNGKTIVDKDGEIFLKQVQEITLTQMDQVVQQADAKIGHPEVSVKVDPTIFLVVVKSVPNRRWMFNFYDESMSERVSKAFQHAVELCGGGHPDPF
jgi:hypothetical protein